MSIPELIALVGGNGAHEIWRRRTLSEMGKAEEFLEDALARSPQLIGLEGHRTGIRGPFAVFRQVTLTTPTKRTIYPDIVLLSASGHFIVVEVKLSTNRELKDRDVIAQIIDYASSLTVIPEQVLVTMLCKMDKTGSNWPELVSKLFPHEAAPAKLADAFVARLRAGELHIVVACDGLPPGLPEVIRGITSQASLSGFSLDLFEVIPFVPDTPPEDRVIFVPRARIETEVVARTLITVNILGGASPTVEVQTMRLDEIEAKVREVARSGADDSTMWTADAIETAVRESADATAIALLDFAKKQSGGGQFCFPARRKYAVFGFYLSGGSGGGYGGGIEIFISNVEKVAGLDVAREFSSRLCQIFGEYINMTKAPKQPGVSAGALREHLHEFEVLLLWLKEAATCP